jgi:hypothetical protein
LPSVVLTCASCGSEEPEGARFCGSCGTPFEADDPQPAADVPTDVAPPPVWPDLSPSDPVPPPAVRDDAELAHTPSIEAPPRVPPPSAWPGEPSPSHAPQAPASKTGSDRRVPLPVLIAVLALLVVGGAVGALFGTGVIGGDSGTSESAFVTQVNDNVLSPLGQAEATAAGNARTVDGAVTRAADGTRIVRVADDASAYLRGLNGLSAQQKSEVRLLLAFVAVHRGYGQAFAAFTSDNSDGELALDSAAAEVRAAIATVAGRLPTGLQLPSQTAIITLRATPPAPDVGAVYVRQIDGLLQQSHAVVLALRSFVPRAASDSIDRSTAVTLARSYVGQRRVELAQARALTVPSAFASAQQLLLRSLEASLADDQALLIWTVARRDGSGDTRAAFARANRLGAQATALKQQFLRVYGPQRQATTGLSPESLPANF